MAASASNDADRANLSTGKYPECLFKEAAEVLG
jgi:hypothetical protein